MIRKREETRPTLDFGVSAAYFRIMTLAYNLAALKHFVLDESWRDLSLKTIRFGLLSTSAIVTKHAWQLWLKLPRGRTYTGILRHALARRIRTPKNAQSGGRGAPKNSTKRLRTPFVIQNSSFFNTQIPRRAFEKTSPLQD
ncbi:hypothetical protein ACFL1X_05785 [Candidatus Hydrogenedentota bacterium]